MVKGVKSMKKEEHEQLLSKILENAKDPAAVSDALTALREDYGATLATLQLTSADNESLKRQNDEIVKQNMKLFLKLGTGSPETPAQNDQPKKYEDLFDEKGKLK
jgi:hypothetical protein